MSSKMKLLDIVTGVDVRDSVGDMSVTIGDIVFDSRGVSAGSLFVAVEGSVVDGHEYISAAVSSGAVAVVCNRLPADLNPAVTYVAVSDSSKALGLMASTFCGNPSKELKLVGITGTNGKTTTATLLYNLFSELGYRVGLISTVAYYVGDKRTDSTHTTPDAVRLNSMLDEMVQAGCEYCFMEVSSHSVVQHRIEGLTFAGGLFTNITHDHLDYHKTFAEYIKAKKGFFDSLSADAFALYNGDDRNGSMMIQNSKAKASSFALKSMATYRCKIVEALFGGTELEINGTRLWVNFIGEFNAYNLLGVYATAIELGADSAEVLRIISTLKPVSGRFEYVVAKNGVVAIVDYAHTPDALDNVIRSIDEIRTSCQKLIVVVGCGGNRDKTKRPIMAKIAATKSDFAILTSDNPRFEKPDDILADMTAGTKSETGELLSENYVVISDRREAIKMAVRMAAGVSQEAVCKGVHGDIILIAGKGHETYQEVEGVRHHFDDKEIVSQLFGL